MPRQKVPLGVFRSLNLTDQAGLDDGGTLIDCADIELSERGRAQRRKKLARFGPALLGFPGYKRWFASYGGGKKRLVCWDNNGKRCRAVNPVSGDATWFSDDFPGYETWNFERFSNVATEYVYAALGPAASSGVTFYDKTVVRYDPAADTFSRPGFTAIDWDVTQATPRTKQTNLKSPLARIAAVWPTTNRMAYAGFQSGATGPASFGSGSESTNSGDQTDPTGVVRSLGDRVTAGPDYVFFSQPNDAETINELDFVRLGPGDGDAIQAIVGWRDLLFVFKQRRFWVFTGVSTNFQGVSTFQSRAIDVGVGAVGPDAVTVGDDGVYFVTEKGLYRTRGAEPEILSGAVEGLWTRELPATFSGEAMKAASLSTISCNIVRDQVFITYEGTGDLVNQPTFCAVYDILGEWWSIWRAGGKGASTTQLRDVATTGGLPFEVFAFRFTDAPELVQSMGGTLLREGATPSDTTDNPYGFMQTAWTDDGVARVRRQAAWEIAGKGSLEAGFITDFDVVPARADSQNVLLGSDGLLANREIILVAQRGRSFSFYAYGNEGSAGWAIDEVIKHVGGVQPPTNIHAVNG